MMQHPPAFLFSRSSANVLPLSSVLVSTEDSLRKGAFHDPPELDSRVGVIVGNTALPALASSPSGGYKRRFF